MCVYVYMCISEVASARKNERIDLKIIIKKPKIADEADSIMHIVSLVAVELEFKQTISTAIESNSWMALKTNTN